MCGGGANRLRHLIKKQVLEVGPTAVSSRCFPAEIRDICECSRADQISCYALLLFALLAWASLQVGIGSLLAITYGVAPISRLLKMIGLFCKRAL